MPFGLSPEDKVAKATEEYGQQLRDLYKHECYGSKKKESCHILAEFYASIEMDIDKAKELYEHTCKELNFNESCLALGNLYLTNKKFKDPEKAMSLFQEGCEKKSPGACNNAGLLYQKGVKGSTIEKDLPKAIELFTKACNYGHRNGCFNLSAIYLTGKDGIPKDMKKAFELSLKSCEMSHPWGCINVSRMYALGDGVEKNPQEAEKFKRLAKLYSGQD
ncbi:cytochrome c oxidase assembly factor 7B-like [Stylophora pistillata]|uniref:Cytochrome c oxidase assembly factor 7B n=1 Tax=Stylophora pistillata TaxID=50429 RepID=A0A2B4SHN8_STYPI|nr:cytochrome c oxidase assembly factor 7B-like [Stylophora pistillata]PFX28002.1 Cytochrome c oxidase assembly factor 7B [Stylophora pistillata]